MPKSFTPCAYCDDKSAGACPRCGAPVCGLHGPWKPGYACRRCEEAWDAARRARRIAVVPSIVIALGAGALLAAGVAVGLHEAHVDIGLGVLGLGLGLPSALALTAKRRADQALRRRFLATPPPDAALRSPASPSAPPTGRG